jgi:hypothetical protein
MVHQYIGSKAELHEALDRNGYYVPPLKSCKLQYLQDIMAKIVWVPHYTEVRIKSCYRPPSKKIVYDALMVEANTCKRNLGTILLVDSDRDWMLNILSTICPNHPFFAKSFIPTKVEKRKFLMGGHAPVQIDASFLSGLPIGKAKKKTVKFTSSPEFEEQR